MIPRGAQLFAFLAVSAVLAMNLACAIAFIARPETYAPGFEVAGVPGAVIVRGFGILFVMWNIPHLVFLLQPQSRGALLAVILLQQAVGLAGETWLYLELPAGHAALRATGLRFIVFDAAGLTLLMSVTAALLVLARRSHHPPNGQSIGTSRIAIKYTSTVSSDPTRMKSRKR